LRVKPGDPDHSFVVRKVELPGIGEGAAMPPGNQELTEYYRSMLRSWIEAGAKP
jgi:uncharacterized membrane protein